MTYSNKFVMAVLVDGQPIKELANGEVHLPFGTEYVLRFRNKHNRQAVVKILIDGENVSGGGYVIQPQSHIDIKRHHDVDRAFKFVSLDSPDAVDHGKNGPNPDKTKGVIEAQFYLEKERKVSVRPIVHEHHHHHHHPIVHDHYRRCSRGPIKPLPTSAPNPWVGVGDQPYYGMSYGLESKSNSSCTSRGVTISSCFGFNSTQPADIPTQDCAENLSLQEGCTVEGHSTGQQFYTTHVDLEDSCTTLRLFLKGYQQNDSSNVAETIPSRTKTNKDQRLEDLESENEQLRLKLAEIENEKLKEKLKELQS